MASRLLASVPCCRRKSSAITPGFASRYRIERMMSAVKAGRCAAWFLPVAALFVCRPGARVRRCTIRHGPHVRPDQTLQAAPKRHNFRGLVSKARRSWVWRLRWSFSLRRRISVVCPSVLGSWRKLASGATKGVLVSVGPSGLFRAQRPCPRRSRRPLRPASDCWRKSCGWSPERRDLFLRVAAAQCAAEISCLELHVGVMEG